MEAQTCSATSCGSTTTCTDSQVDNGEIPALIANAPVDMLARIAETYGTPTYAYDVRRVQAQIYGLRANLPSEIDLLYSLKANPSLGLCAVIADGGLGADVASAGELQTALKAGFAPERIFSNGPHKSPETIALMRLAPQTILSIDSVSELEKLIALGLSNRAVLRLRPDYPSTASCGIGQDSRFGIGFEELEQCREILASSEFSVVGFHVFSGSQMTDSAAVIQHLRNALDLSLRAAEVLNIEPAILNLGGGFGVPYGAADRELDLVPIGQELRKIVDRVKPTRVVIELGRYIVAQCGWYLTSVVGLQSRGGRQAAVVDGGVHHRSEICSLGMFARGLPPITLGRTNADPTPTDILGCLCLPHDVLVESTRLTGLAVGDVVAFPNGGAYGLSASPLSFLSHPLPAEALFDGTTIGLVRPRQTVEALLHGQSCVRNFGRPDAANEGDTSTTQLAAE